MIKKFTKHDTGTTVVTSHEGTTLPDSYPSEYVMKQRAMAIVIAIVGVRNADDWWNNRNAAFPIYTSYGLRTPAGQWLIDPTVVYTYLMQHSNVDYS